MLRFRPDKAQDPAMSTYHVITFGCQMNQHDSQRMEEVLSKSGYVKSDGVAEADVIVLNTCSVREKAEQKLRSEVGRLGVLKKHRPELIIAVAGCVAQQEGEKLVKSLPQIDVVIGPDNIPQLPQLLRDAALGTPSQVKTVFDIEAPEFLSAEPEVVNGISPSTFVTTMKGCDERCTFCIVPTTRGPERYRPSDEIIGEIVKLTEAGVREITLLGQTVDSYIDPKQALEEAPGAGEGRHWLKGSLLERDETQFPALLRAIVAAAPKLLRLRYTSPHPRHLTPALVRAHVDIPQLAHHSHMPVQSGSERILKRMGRRYTIEEYQERTLMLKAAVPGLTLSTDIIVGFPGESDEDFQATLDIVKTIGFIGVYGFKYSERPGTPALKLKDDVPEEIKAARLAALFDLSEGMRYEHLKSLVGSVQEVLIESRTKNGAYSGRSMRNEIVHCGGVEGLVGRILRVKIDKVFKHSLAGTIVEEAMARPLPPMESKGPAQTAPKGKFVPSIGRSLPVVS